MQQQVMADARNWIGGQATTAEATIDNVAPWTGKRIGAVARSDADDVQAAVDAAQAAQPEWARRSMQERCQVLSAAADLVEERADELAWLEAEDAGKTLHTATTVDIPRASRNLRFFAEYAQETMAQPETFDSELGHNYAHRRPVGIAGLITPWNLPLYLLSWKAAPALAMGNAVIAKPSESTPRTATALGEILRDAGLPDGLYNVVHGLGPEAGQALVEHPDVGAVSFTGGTATGKKVAATAAPMFKKLSLELGGKNPSIVFADCDLQKTVAGVVRAAFTNTGQVCLCGSRILVQEDIQEAFTKRLIAAVQELSPGDPTQGDGTIGALISADHRNKVEHYLDLAEDEGGTICCGGKRPMMPAEYKDGYWLQPAVITGLDQSARCVQEEIFGPVVTVQSFTTEEEAVALANDVDYGLAATVWSGDDKKAKRVAEALETGMVWINDWLVRDLRVPFGGVKASGVGREGGRWSLEFFSEVGNVYTG